MATLKHIASKNSDYTAIEAYLVYQHDAFTGKQLLDEQGRPMLRESYILDTQQLKGILLLFNYSYFYVSNLSSPLLFPNIPPGHHSKSNQHSPAGHYR